VAAGVQDGSLRCDPASLFTGYTPLQVDRSLGLLGTDRSLSDIADRNRARLDYRR
jgi:hypothetical protein